jgi:hypothetical protein
MNAHADMLVAFALAAVTVVAGGAYFRRHAIVRPPVGVINLRDVGVLMAAIVVVPYLYLAVPLAVVTAIQAVAVLTLLSMAAQPLLGGAGRAYAVAGALVAADIAIALASGTTGAAFLVVNNLVVVAFSLSAANLWAQSGMRARDATVLGAGLIVYDLIATSQLTLMEELIERLSHGPLMPFVFWNASDGGLGIGFGDLVLASVFPLVLRKAFGPRAGAVAIAAGIGAIGLLMGLVEFGVVGRTVPAMVALGPLMLAQYAFWRRRRGAERTTHEYLLAEPLPAHATA